MKFCLTMKKSNNKAIIYCSVVGDSLVGKTKLIEKFLKNENTNDHTATVFDNIAGEVLVVGRNYTVSMFDTTGQHEFGGLRYFPYAQSNVVVLCYSVTDRTSFNNISNFWIKEVKKHCRKSVPIILVSTHCDLAAGRNNYVKRHEGALLAMKIGASRLIETSMYDLDNISTLFESVVTEAIEKKRNILKKLLGL